MPKAIEGLADVRSGLILLTGPTGSGKSTTLAAIVDRINSTYSKHIVTIEDPVEFVHRDKRCRFSQREGGTDTESFSAALRAAIRQDADVIREGNTPMITTIMQGGRAIGMQLMDDALAAQVEAKRVTPREAYLKATNKARFENLIDD